VIGSCGAAAVKPKTGSFITTLPALIVPPVQPQAVKVPTMVNKSPLTASWPEVEKT
jgi:hypothetical protein